MVFFLIFLKILHWEGILGTLRDAIRDPLLIKSSISCFAGFSFDLYNGPSKNFG